MQKVERLALSSSEKIVEEGFEEDAIAAISFERVRQCWISQWLVAYAVYVTQMDPPQRSSKQRSICSKHQGLWHGAVLEQAQRPGVYPGIQLFMRKVQTKWRLEEYEMI